MSYLQVLIADISAVMLPGVMLLLLLLPRFDHSVAAAAAPLLHCAAVAAAAAAAVLVLHDCVEGGEEVSVADVDVHAAAAAAVD